MPAPSSDSSRDQLTGWKEIASYLSKSVRTVQRWETRYRLPVHRVPGSADVVLASKEEIERWKRSEAYDEIGEAERREMAGPPPPIVAPRPSRRLPASLLLGSAALLVLTAVAIYLVRGRESGSYTASRGAVLFDATTVPLTWHPMEGRVTAERQASGLLVDPGFVVVQGSTVAFEYLKQGGQGRARPYVYSVLQPPPENPSLRFTYMPHQDARVSHWAGFAANEEFVRKGEETLGYWVPRRGLALRLDRTSNAYVNSRASLWIFEEGQPREIAPERPLGFQMEPGRQYSCALSLEAGRVWATVSDGGRIEALAGTIEPGLRPGVVFFADAHDGVSSLSPSGRYRLQFDDPRVVDLQYRVELALLSAASRTGGPSNTRALPVAVASNPDVDATALDQRSLRLSGAALLPGSSNQGFDCRRQDVDGDGVFDLVCDFDRQALGPGSGRRDLILRGRTLYGRRIAGRLVVPGALD